MKTQKVEIELPDFEDWEFVRFGKLKESEFVTDYFGMLSLDSVETHPHIIPGCAYMMNNSCFLYRRKLRRRVVLEEYKIDYLQVGDIYMDAYGNVNKRFYTDYDQVVKYPILKKIKDEFND